MIIFITKSSGYHTMVKMAQITDVPEELATSFLRVEMVNPECECSKFLQNVGNFYPSAL